MKIIVDGIAAFDHTYTSWDELYEDFVRDEIAADREVPGYLLETLLIVVTAWLLKKAGDELFTEWRDWRNRRRAAQDHQRQREEDERRHEELMEKIDEIVRELGEEKIDGEKLITKLKAAGYAVEMIPQSDAERDIVSASPGNVGGDDETA